MSGDVSDRLEALERRLGELEARLDDDGIPDEWSEDTGDTGPSVRYPEDAEAMVVDLRRSLAAARLESDHLRRRLEVVNHNLHQQKSEANKILEADRDRWVAEAEAYRIRAEAGFRIFLVILDLFAAPLGWARTHEEAKEIGRLASLKRDHKARRPYGGFSIAVWAVDPDGAHREGGWMWIEDGDSHTWVPEEDQSSPSPLADRTGE